jgi:hypothetical protein
MGTRDQKWLVSSTSGSAIAQRRMSSVVVKLAAWAAALKMNLQIVARRTSHAFEVLPRRWVVERTFAWISKHRRTIRDYKRLPASHEAMIIWAMTSLMACRLAQPSHLYTHETRPRWRAHGVKLDDRASACDYGPFSVASRRA